MQPKCNNEFDSAPRTLLLQQFSVYLDRKKINRNTHWSPLEMISPDEPGGQASATQTLGLAPISSRLALAKPPGTVSVDNVAPVCVFQMRMVLSRLLVATSVSFLDNGLSTQMQQQYQTVQHSIHKALDIKKLVYQSLSCQTKIFWHMCTQNLLCICVLPALISLLLLTNLKSVQMLALHIYKFTTVKS